MTAGLDQFEQHHDPLPALREQLAREFEGVLPADQIYEVSERAITSFGDVKVHAFLPILALRRARDSLRRSSAAKVGSESGD